MFHYEMCLMHYIVLVFQPVNTCEGHIVCPCDMGLVQSLMGMMEERHRGGRSLHTSTFTAILYVRHLNIS